MYCRNCGAKLVDTNICVRCGTKIKDESISNIQNNLNSESKKMDYNISEDLSRANILCIISILCTFPIPLFDIFIWRFTNYQNDIFVTLFSLGFILPIVGFILALIAHSKYPNSNFAKGLLKLYATLFILAVVFVIISIILTLKSCSNMG